MGSDVRLGQSSSANTAALPADVSTAVNICLNKTNQKLQRIEKLNLKKKKKHASRKNKVSRNNVCQTGESYVNREVVKLWGKKFHKIQGNG
ncbi:hypothetical protein, partial [Klebsiella pneumoniae]|uniref:hypothetical protein n=1 Tax=Klebsiella pneumoniae TaxID=573 RepID=UPI00358F0B2F